MDLGNLLYTELKRDKLNTVMTSTVQ